MNKQLSDVLARVSELTEERQQAAAVVLLDFLDSDPDIELTPEQVSEIERRLAEDDVASDEEVRSSFDRMKR